MNIPKPKTISFGLAFRNIMFDNMWTYINTDVISTILEEIGVGIKAKMTKKYIDFSNEYVTDSRLKNTICYSKFNKDEGHYYYVDNNLKKHGTFERKLLTRDEDNGVCHSAAIIYAIMYNRNKLSSRFKIIEGKNNRVIVQNYITILEMYQYLIESGVWDMALLTHFGNSFNKDEFIETENGGYTTVQTQTALRALKIYINHLKSLKIKN
jgi:hypothetical protein